MALLCSYSRLHSKNSNTLRIKELSDWFSNLFFFFLQWFHKLDAVLSATLSLASVLRGSWGLTTSWFLRRVTLLKVLISYETCRIFLTDLKTSQFICKDFAKDIKNRCQICVKNCGAIFRQLFKTLKGIELRCL